LNLGPHQRKNFLRETGHPYERIKGKEKRKEGGICDIKPGEGLPERIQKPALRWTHEKDGRR